MLQPDEIIADLFAGGGGASVGIRAAVGRDPDVAINHDAVALAMHEVNHPNTWHLRQDIWEVSPKWATKRWPVGLLWASPDCKHFSKAKGAAPNRSREIRSLAWVVERWARDVRPRVIILENVEEFRNWGPLDRKGRVIKSQKGTIFRAFERRLRRLGYQVEWTELRACDYGAPTIRKRLFLIARCDGLPIVWPKPTHGPGLNPYRTAADIIDWSIPCPSIFQRKRPLVENTMRRIAEGIRRYVIEAAEPFIVKYYGPKKGETFRGSGINEPLATQTTENRFGLVVPHLQRQFGQGVGSSMQDPVGTVMSSGLGKTALVAAFMAQHNGGYFDGAGRSMKDPISTITHHGTQQQLVTSNLIKLYGTCKAGQPVTGPMATVTASGTHIGEVRAFLTKYYGKSCGQPLSDPTATITTKDRIGLVTVQIKGQPYVIADIGMRMLSPRELFRAQGFDDSYQIDLEINGKPITKTNQVRCCGNSVCPPLAQVLVEANFRFNEVLKTAT
jgi:DNA (cytosine-5)-methyltransferase 1